MDQKKMNSKSVESLQRIYSIIIAIAIAYAINDTFIHEGEIYLSNINNRLAQFIAFAFTIIPFYHGMDVHLINAYTSKKSNPIKGAILIDFSIFFIESTLLIGIAATIKSNSIDTIILYAILLLLDAIWAYLSWNIHYRTKKKTNTWSLINLFTVAFIVAIYLTNFFDSPETKWWMVATVLILRTVLDYTLTSSFYFDAEDD